MNYTTINVATDEWIDPDSLGALVGVSLVEGPLAEYTQVLSAYQAYLAECDLGHRRQADVTAEWRVQVGQRIRQGQPAQTIWETLGEPSAMPNVYAKQLAGIARDIALSKQAVLQEALNTHYAVLEDRLERTI